VRHQAGCERWALLPLLLGLCTRPTGSAAATTTTTTAAAAAAAVSSSLQRDALCEGLQLGVSEEAGHVLILDSLVSAWHTALTQASAPLKCHTPTIHVFWCRMTR
jgi:hypothetical protein